MKPLPKITPLTRPFWQGCRQGELRLQCCTGCGDFRFFPAEACHACGDPRFQWQRVDGTGKVYSWIVVHRPVDEWWARDVPFTILVVALDLPGRPLVTGTFERGQPGPVTAGMRVEAGFEAVDDEVSLLRWRRAAT